MITVDALLKSQNLSSLKVVAGRKGLSREVSSVSVMDAPDSYKWLKGGEFILSTGFLFGGDDWQVEHFVRNLIEAGCSAFGIKKGRFLHTIPQTVVEVAEQNQFPIIDIPYYFGWTDIISTFYVMQSTSKNTAFQESSKPLATKEEVNEHFGNYESFSRKFLLKMHFGELTTQDTNNFEKLQMSGNNTFYAVMIIDGSGREDILRDVLNILGNPILARKSRANLLFVEIEKEQTSIALLEVCIADGDKPERWQHKLAEELEYYICETNAGGMSMGRLHHGADGLVKSYNEAIKSRNLGKSVCKGKRFLYYPFLSVYDAFQNADTSKVDFSYINELAAHQETLGFDGIESIEAYIELGSSKAAAKLFAHENSLRHRMQRVADLLHLDLHDNWVRYNLLMQIKLWRLRVDS